MTKSINCINNLDWSDVLCLSNPQECHFMFLKKVSDLYDLCFLIKEEICYMPNGRRMDQCAMIIKILQRIIRVDEKGHYEKMFGENRDNIAKSWKLIRNIINNKKCNRNNGEFHINNSKIADKTIIPEKINAFYVNIEPSFTSKIPTGKCDPISYIRNGVHSTILLRPVKE